MANGLDRIRLEVEGECAKCGNAQWELLGGDGKDVALYGNGEPYMQGSQTIGYLACWCTVRHMYIQTPRRVCGGFAADEEPQLEDFLEGEEEPDFEEKKD